MSFDRQHGRGLEGTVLQGSFRLTRLIGQGGMGTVYEGTQIRLDKRVAVKLLARELSSNVEALARFRREAEVTSRLGHPHIVQVFDFGTAPGGEPYLVMEFLEGEDLDARLRRAGQQSPAATNHVIRQIASALSSTHARGIVHRDLKPANIFLLDIEGETDFIKVVDFGISKVRAASVRLTGQSAVIGTPQYMSPEQAQGLIEDIDHKTDQWSLACIAYEMLAARPPFVGDNPLALLYQVTHEEPPTLATLVPNLPGDLSKIVARALSKRRQDRFPTVSAFSRAFAAAATATPLAAPADGKPLPVPADGKPLPRTRVMDAQPPPPAPEGRKARATTLSLAVRETSGSLGRPRPRRRTKWVAAGVGGAAALAIGALLARSGARRNDQDEPPAVAEPTEQEPVAVPPPAPAATVQVMPILAPAAAPAAGAAEVAAPAPEKTKPPTGTPGLEVPPASRTPATAAGGALPEAARAKHAVNRVSAAARPVRATPVSAPADKSNTDLRDPFRDHPTAPTVTPRTEKPKRHLIDEL